jgi:aspartyl aminopeptidase
MNTQTNFSLDDLFHFLDNSPSAFHAAAQAAARLDAAGYTRCEEGQAWSLAPGGKYYTTRNGSAVLAWRMPRGELTGWHATCSHADSPSWKVKVLDLDDGMYARAETEGYGGMIMPTWMDRPLSVAGRLLVRTADGVESRLVAPQRALLCIPNMCIHFARDMNTGMNYNPQVDLQPICGEAGGKLSEVLAEEAGVAVEDILATDLLLTTTQKAERVGVKGEYFMSGRIDDLECAYTTLCGFLAGRGEEAGRGDIWCMFDNEEVGSSTRQGAQGTLMTDVLARIEESLGITREQSIRARNNSLLLSADNGHARHPNHPEKSDPHNPVKMGGGVLLKYAARQSYTTSGFTGAAFETICRAAEVPVQIFANRADVPGGGTLGNLLGHQLGMPMVDIGLAQLAMHSAMETASCRDAEYMVRACAAYYNTPIFQPADGVWKLGV